MTLSKMTRMRDVTSSLESRLILGGLLMVASAVPAIVWFTRKRRLRLEKASNLEENEQRQEECPLVETVSSVKEEQDSLDEMPASEPAGSYEAAASELQSLNPKASISEQFIDSAAQNENQASSGDQVKAPFGVVDAPAASDLVEEGHLKVAGGIPSLGSTSPSKSAEDPTQSLKPSKMADSVSEARESPENFASSADQTVASDESASAAVSQSDRATATVVENSELNAGHSEVLKTPTDVQDSAEDGRTDVQGTLIKSSETIEPTAEGQEGFSISAAATATESVEDTPPVKETLKAYSVDAESQVSAAATATESVEETPPVKETLKAYSVEAESQDGPTGKFSESVTEQGPTSGLGENIAEIQKPKAPDGENSPAVSRPSQGEVVGTSIGSFESISRNFETSDNSAPAAPMYEEIGTGRPELSETRGEVVEEPLSSPSAMVSSKDADLTVEETPQPLTPVGDASSAPTSYLRSEQSKKQRTVAGEVVENSVGSVSSIISKFEAPY